MTDSRPTCRSTCRSNLGRHVGQLSADTLRYFTATRPILHRHSASNTLILSALDTELYLLYSTVQWSFLALWEGLLVAFVLFWPFSPITFTICLFSSYLFSSSSLLYKTLVIFFLIETSERHFTFLGSRTIGGVAEHKASSCVVVTI